MKRTTLALALAWILLTSGCASLHAAKAPNTDLSSLKTFYVARLPADQRGVDQLISDRLNRMGRQATAGSEPSPPAPVDAIVTYQDRWNWDMTMFMIELNIQIRDGTTRAIVAKGQSIRPSLERRSPEGMVDEVIQEIFKQ